MANIANLDNFGKNAGRARKRCRSAIDEASQLSPISVASIGDVRAQELSLACPHRREPCIRNRHSTVQPGFGCRGCYAWGVRVMLRGETNLGARDDDVRECHTTLA